MDLLAPTTNSVNSTLANSNDLSKNNSQKLKDKNPKKDKKKTKKGSLEKRLQQNASTQNLIINQIAGKIKVDFTHTRYKVIKECA